MAVFSSSRSPERTGSAAAGPRPLSVLAEGLRVVGDIHADGVVKIEGRMEGDVRGSSQVLVARGGSVAGSVTADEVVVSGRVEGNVTAKRRVAITDGGVVLGDVTAPRVAVEEGGEVNGRLRMERRSPGAPALQELRKTA